MDDVDTLRRFNRTWSQRIGALDDYFLGLGIPLGASRLVFEIGPDGATVRELRQRLDLDSGYLSRLLRALEDRELAVVAADPDDRRRRRVSLTRSGWATRVRLEERSDGLARTLLAPLTSRQRDRLNEALGTADLLMRAATVHPREVDPTSPVAVAAVEAYFSELADRFPGGFDATGARAGDAVTMGPGCGTFVVATSDGSPVACGGVQTIERGVGEVKRMWVHPAWRGAGLGSRLLRHLEALASGLGNHVVRLDTHRSLTEAIEMYERAGYRAIGRYNDNPHAQAWFEKFLGTGPVVGK